MAMNGQRSRRREPDAFDPDERTHELGRRPRGSNRLLLLVIVVLGAALVVALVRPGNHQRQTATTPPAPSPTSTSANTAPAVPTSVAGVPVGYPDTRDGANAAAANYAVAYGSDAMFNTDRRHAIVSAVADPSVEAALQAQLDQSFAAVMGRFGLDAAGNPPQGQTFVDRAVPVGVHLLSYSDSEAQVAVWTTGLVGLAGATSTLPVTEAWNTETITLHWTGGDWKWVAFTQTDGPTPVSGMQTPSNAAQIANAVKEFGGLAYAR